MQPSNGGACDSDQQQQKQSPPQQWVAMQYPMMAPPHYMPYSRHHQPVPVSQRGGGENNNKAIWVGDLHNWMDEDYLRSCFASTGEVASIKVIRNKHTGFPEGYGFVEFNSHSAAEKVLQTYGSVIMPNTDQPFRLNWATFSTGDRQSNNNAYDLSIFVGDLAADVTDTLLHETFADKYPSVKAAKVVIDISKGRSKGYGFVRFGDDNERTQAMSEMNGAYCSSRPMRIGLATPKKPPTYQSDGDSNNTTIFVGGLDSSVSDEDLKQPFIQYGEILSVKIPVGKGCGFVQFDNRASAEEALQKLNGTTIGKQSVRLSWGRNLANKQLRHDIGNQWPAPYYVGQFYGGYGYAMAAMQPPSMYGAGAGAGAAYGGYGAPQQQVN
ncbi:polyadenylate-binding protein RBP47C'-like [Bidens hawaiensis]|uniref:polyadenylate-binding protein RBP47C'-like n=1 Tax=Bidens hawaiensis TaxID=980011 RepID=UPI00404B5B2C